MQQRWWCPGHGHWGFLCSPWESSHPQGCPLPTHTLAAAPFGVTIPVTAACAVTTSFPARSFSCKAFQTKLRKELGERAGLFHALYRWELQVFRDLKASFFISEHLYLKLLPRCTCLPTSVSPPQPGAPRRCPLLPHGAAALFPACSDRQIIAVTGNVFCSSHK